MGRISNRLPGCFGYFDWHEDDGPHSQNPRDRMKTCEEEVSCQTIHQRSISIQVSGIDYHHFQKFGRSQHHRVGFGSHCHHSRYRRGDKHSDFPRNQTQTLQSSTLTQTVYLSFLPLTSWPIPLFSFHVLRSVNHQIPPRQNVMSNRHKRPTNKIRVWP